MPEVTPVIGESFHPLIWVEWVGSDGQRRYWALPALVDPDTYYGGFKQGLLLVPGPVVRALSDEDGQYQAQTFLAQVSDPDYDVRGLLGQTDTRRFLVNTLLVLRMISDADRRALLTPRTVAIGVVRAYELG